jgi:DELLA protein
MAFLPFYRLMECAKGIEGGNLDIADSLLVEIRSLAPKKKSISTRKVVKYCAEAFARLACLLNSSSMDPLPLLTPYDPVDYQNKY